VCTLSILPRDLHSIQSIDDIIVNTVVSSIPYFGFVPRVYRRISVLHPPVKKFRTLSFFRSALFVISEFFPRKKFPTSRPFWPYLAGRVPHFFRANTGSKVPFLNSDRHCAREVEILGIW
jgi:hypothetical protein